MTPMSPDPAPDATARSMSGTGQLSGRTFVLAVASVTLSQGIASYDIAGMPTLTRTILSDLGTTLTAVQYGVSGQALFAAAFMMVAARLGALFGRTRILVWGLVIRLVGMILTALAPNIFFFIFGRAVLGGIGIALTLVNGLAIIGNAFTGSHQVRAASAVAASTAVATVTAPLIAGVLAESLGWRWFFVVGAIGILLALALSRSAPVVEATSKSENLDLLGAVLAVISFGCVIIGIQQVAPWGLIEVRDAPFTVLGKSPAPFFFLAGLVLVAGFVGFEHLRRLAGKPVLFDLQMLRKRFIRNGDLAVIGFSAIIAGFTFLIPVYLQVFQGLTPLQSSLRTCFTGVGGVVSVVMLRRIVQRYSLRRIFALAVAFGLLGLFSLAWDVGPFPEGAVPLSVFFIGLTIPLTKSSLNMATLRAVPPVEHGQLSGLNESSWSLGGSLGVAIVGTILLATLAGGVSRLVLDDPAISDRAQAIVQEYVEQGVPLGSAKRVRTVLTERGLPPSDIDILTDHYLAATNRALLWAIGGAAVISLMTATFVWRLPRKNPEFDDG